jgi:hypothetical protein
LGLDPQEPIDEFLLANGWGFALALRHNANTLREVVEDELHGFPVLVKGAQFDDPL